MIPFLINLLILLIIFGVIWYIIDLLPIIPPQFKLIAKAIIGVILLLILLSMLGGYAPSFWPRSTVP